MEKETLPHSKTALTLGILSIITACCCNGFIGVILGIFGFLQAKKAIEIDAAEPGRYDGIKNANTGKTTSIIGIVVGIVSAIWLIYLLSSGQFDIMMQEYQEILEQNM